MIRKWYWTFTAFVILCIGCFLIFKPKPSLEPVKTYKVVTPAPKLSPTEPNREGTEATQHSHDHSYGPASHFHTAETTTNGDRYDWRNDNAFYFRLFRTYTNLTNMLKCIRIYTNLTCLFDCCRNFCFNVHCLTSEVLHGLHRRLASPRNSWRRFRSSGAQVYSCV